MTTSRDTDPPRGQPASAADWIRQLELRPHPEGGHYAEVWRSSLRLPASAIPHDGPRDGGTSIHFLLEGNEVSRWHRVASDELWIHLRGDPAVLTVADEPVAGIDQPGGDAMRTDVALDIRTLGAACLQSLVGAGRWQTTRVKPGANGFALFACVVVPGFDFADFELTPSR